jgi:clan AA aspartic protease (TIGR02281 family)
MKAEKPELTPDDIELRPDAWERFVDAVKRVAGDPPIRHAKPGKSNRGKRERSKRDDRPFWIAAARRRRKMNRSVPVFAALALAAAPLPCTAQTLTKCIAGQAVVDQEGKIGTIVSEGGALCQVRYGDGQTYGWIYWNLRLAPYAAKPDLPAANPGPPQPPRNAASATDVPAVTVLRPATTHARVYRAGSNGHFVLSAEVNGAPVRFLVDTGASLIFLTPDDARAAGINPRELDYTQLVTTGSGLTRAAPVVLDEVRIDDLSLDNVRAAVLDSLGQSVLGMSFLGRLKGFEMHEGSLTIDW